MIHGGLKSEVMHPSRRVLDGRVAVVDEKRSGHLGVSGSTRSVTRKGVDTGRHKNGGW